LSRIHGCRSSGWLNCAHCSTPSWLPAAGIDPTAREPVVGRGQDRQKKLFDETLQTAELRPKLRCKIALLLQALLMEVAAVQQRRTESAARDGGGRG
jgi:hypothetical protein